MSANCKKVVPPEIKDLYMNTNNLLASESLKRKVTLIPVEEILAGLHLTIDNWKNNPNSVKNEERLSDTSLLLFNPHLLSEIDDLHRHNYKIVVKMFIYNEKCSVFRDGLDFVMKQLKISQIDSLILSLPPSPTKLSLDLMKPIWNCVQKIVKEKRVLDVGVTDLDTNQLKDLYLWAQEVKPSTNQVNLEACCVIPPEMTKFANENNVRLLTHNDPRDFVPLDKFNDILTACEITNPEQWKREWVARYSVMVKGKGIIENKGYILLAHKNE